jgi:hypothetical protein
MAEQKSTTGIIIVGFLIALLGIILVGVIAENEQKVTTTTRITNESIDISSLRVGLSQINMSNTGIATAHQYTSGTWQTETSDCNPNSYGIILTNGTGTVFTLNTDYNLTSAGRLYMKNTTATNASVTNTTLLSYNYCQDQYMPESWQRTIMNLIPADVKL